jgi:RNA polymerase sigma factor (TIGR02999 family)
MADATQLLNAIRGGDQQAAAELIPLVYQELRQLARKRLAHEAAGHTLQATALVHEAYLRLVGDVDAARWENRAHFFGAAAEAMRRILVDSARRKGTLKRGGNKGRREDLDADRIACPQKVDDLLALDEALNRLAEIDRPKADLVKLRYFAGMTIPEAAEVLGVARSTADAWWRYARAWLHRQISDSPSGDSAADDA